MHLPAMQAPHTCWTLYKWELQLQRGRGIPTWSLSLKPRRKILVNKWGLLLLQVSKLWCHHLACSLAASRAVVAFAKMAQKRESLFAASNSNAGDRVSTSSGRLGHRLTGSMSSKDLADAMTVLHGTPGHEEVRADPRSPVWPSLAKYPLRKQRLFILLDDPTKSKAGACVSFFVMVSIVVSVVAFVLETEPGFRSRSNNPN